MANAEKCQEVLDYLLAHPQYHNQSYVISQVEDNIDEENICGTTMCIAGCAMFLDNPKEFMQVFSDPDIGEGLEPHDWETRAAKILGLTGFEAADLFWVMNNDQALHALKEYANGER